MNQCGMWNAECGVHPVRSSECGVRSGRHGSGGGAVLCFTPRSAPRIPHFLFTPHSALRTRHYPGTVLAAVLVVAALAATVAVSVLFMMRAEVGAEAARSRSEQAYNAAMSGMQFAMLLVAGSRDDPTVWYDNPDILKNRLVFDDGSDQWYFTVYADNQQDKEHSRFGLTDEASKLNLNEADEETLRRMPALPGELVDALLDWRDQDGETRSEGAEQDYYDTLPQPYTVRNGPLRTIEEALLIKGFNAGVVYGEDANLNGLLDLNEDDGDDTFPPDDRDGSLNRGLYGLTTVWSWEPNTDRQGQARIDLNGAAAAIAGAGLSSSLMSFIAIYRAEGNRIAQPSDLVEMQYQVKQPHREFPELRPGDVVVPAFEEADLAILMDRFTTSTGQKINGLVNVNTARAEVLAALPGLDENLARQIVDVRTGLDPDARGTTAWLYTSGVLDAAAFKAVAPKLTTRGFQYHVTCIGFGARCGQYRIMEGVVDLAEAQPRLVYLRDLTRVGPPFALNADELERSR